MAIETIVKFYDHLNSPSDGDWSKGSSVCSGTTDLFSFESDYLEYFDASAPTSGHISIGRNISVPIVDGLEIFCNLYVNTTTNGAPAISFNAKIDSNYLKGILYANHNLNFTYVTHEVNTCDSDIRIASGSIGDQEGRWISLRITINEAADVYTYDLDYINDNDNSRGSTKTGWVNVVSGQSLTVSIATITELQIISKWVNPSQLSTRQRAAHLEIREPVTISTLTLAGTAFIPKWKDIEFETHVNGAGSASIIIDESNFGNRARHLANGRQTVYISNSDGVRRFVGNIVRIVIRKHQVTYYLRDAYQKAYNTRARYNAIEYENAIRGIAEFGGGESTTIQDDNTVFVADVYNGYLLAVSQGDQLKRTYNVSFINDFTAFEDTDGATWMAPDDSDGDSDNLYFNDPDLSDANNRYSLKAVGEGQELIGGFATGKYGIRSTFSIYEKVNTNISKLTVRGIIRTRKVPVVSQGDPLPFIQAWNYDTPDFEGDGGLWDDGLGATIKKILSSDISDSGGDDTFGLDETNDIAFEGSTENVTNYIEKQTANTTEGEFNEYQMKVWIPTTGYEWFGNSIHIIKLEVEVEYDAEQESEQGIYYINDTVDSPPQLRMDGDEAWEDRSPLMDGVAVGDTYKIIQDLDAQLVAAFSASTYPYSLSKNLTGASQTGLTSDYRWERLSKLISDAKDLVNSYDWFDYVNLAHKLLTQDNLVDSAVTLTSADVMNYQMGALSEDLDFDGIFENIAVKGEDDNTQREYNDHTVVYPSGDGDEDQVINDTSLETQNSVIEVATKNAAKATDVMPTLPFQMDFSNNPQDYSAVVLGALIAFTEGGIDYSGADKLVVTMLKMKYNDSTKHQEIFDVILARLFNE